MLRFAVAKIKAERKNGGIYLRSPQKLALRSRCVTQWLAQCADNTLNRT
jgi:hypothetical protein